MDQERVDLSALDPRADPVRWEAMVAGVLARAAPAALRERGLLAVLAGWARPTLAAASFAGLVSAGLLAWTLERGAGDALPQTLAESLLPQPLGQWVAEGRMPAEGDLLDPWGEPGAGTEPGGRAP
jgi:hypothetical protein